MITKIKGTLIPVGGNEDKGSHENLGIDFITEGILFHIVRQCGGRKAKILVIPTASSIPEEVGRNYMDAFNMLDCNNVSVLDIRHREQCNDSSFLNQLKECDGVLFSGGNQSRIVDVISNTLFHDLLTRRYINEQFVIAGTSAGAMSMVSEMIMGGSSEECLLKGAVKMREGMNYVESLIIDTHFIKRGRFGRLAEAVASYPNLIGIGLAEDTGMIIKNGNECKVIGSGMVIVFDPNNLSHNNHSILYDNTPMTMANLTTHVLANGDEFILDSRSVKVLPINAAFD
jgi:cyanophycinase